MLSKLSLSSAVAIAVGAYAATMVTSICPASVNVISLSSIVSMSLI